MLFPGPWPSLAAPDDIRRALERSGRRAPDNWSYEGATRRTWVQIPPVPFLWKELSTCMPLFHGVLSLKVAVISSEDSDTRASYRMLLDITGIPWEEVKEVDPTEHMLAIIPEGADPTPLVVPSIVIGSSLQRYFPSSRRVSEKSDLSISGVKVPIYNVHSAPGEKFEGLPVSLYEGNLLVWFDLFRGALKPIKEGSPDLMPLIYVYSRLLLKLMSYLCRRNGLPLVRKMRWPLGMQCCISLGMEVKDAGKIKYLLEKKQLAERVTMFLDREACEKASSRDLERISKSPVKIGVLLEKNLEGVERLYDRISYLRGGKVGIRLNRPLGSFHRIRESLLSLRPLYTSILTIDGNMSSMGSPGPVGEQPKEIPVVLKEEDASALNNMCSMERCIPVIVRSRDFLMSAISLNCWISDFEGLLSWSEARDLSSVDIRYNGRELEVESNSRVSNLMLEIISSRDIFPKEKVKVEGEKGRYLVKVPMGKSRISFSVT